MRIYSIVLHPILLLVVRTYTDNFVVGVSCRSDFFCLLLLLILSLFVGDYVSDVNFVVGFGWVDWSSSTHLWFTCGCTLPTTTRPNTT